MLLNKHPLVINVELAETIGLNESIIVQQIHYWLEINKKQKKNLKEGRYGTYNTYLEWQKQFPFWSVTTIRRIITRLESEGILISENWNQAKYDRTKWYSIDYQLLNEIMENKAREH